MTADDSTGIGLVWMKYTRAKSPTEARQRESGAFDKSLCIPMEILVRVQIFIKRGGFPGLF